ncbi:MAG TPA: nuclear transport factor 2 family protein [Luteimonas sp.]|nr:nuclear transport factor 2 family protein [Luteimonas sp.]
MRQGLAFVLFVAPFAAPAQEAPVAPQPMAPVAVPASAPMSDACAVWARESGFAQAVAGHDAAAFASYLDQDAVFVSGGNATRGADAIAAEWAGLIAGKGVLLHWYPDAVDVGANGAVALSRGPYWMENPSAPPEKRYRRGRFISTWLRGDDGQWHVVFDGGAGDAPVPATADEIANLINGRKDCPAS